MEQVENWYMSCFPESAYPAISEFRHEYSQKVVEGAYKMSQSTVVIAGLVRTISDNIKYLLPRIERLGGMFKHYEVVLYENDSTDSTLSQLLQWSMSNPNVYIINQVLNKKRHEQDRTDDRTNDMAFYRNQYLEFMERKCKDYEYIIMLDTDVRGGYSYEGFANSFSYTWDGCGSNGILYENNRRVFFDSFAFRRLNHPTVHDSDEINGLLYNRGEPLIKVDSCFGGAGIYRREAIEGIRYGGGDCEHAVFHKRMKEAGYNNLYLNPSQIILYNKSEYTYE